MDHGDRALSIDSIKRPQGFYSSLERSLRRAPCKRNFRIEGLNEYIVVLCEEKWRETKAISTAGSSVTRVEASEGLALRHSNVLHIVLSDLRPRSALRLKTHNAIALALPTNNLKVSGRSLIIV